MDGTNFYSWNSYSQQQPNVIYQQTNPLNEMSGMVPMDQGSFAAYSSAMLNPYDNQQQWMAASAPGSYNSNAYSSNGPEFKQNMPRYTQKFKAESRNGLNSPFEQRRMRMNTSDECYGYGSGHSGYNTDEQCDTYQKYWY